MSLSPCQGLAAVMAGQSCRWSALRMSADATIEMCDREELAPLIYHHVREQGVGGGWPAAVLDALGQRARDAAGEELLRGAETRSVVDALAAAGVRAVIIKGTALAYGAYPTPASRPRADTDLLVAPAQSGTARDVLRRIGFVQTVTCEELFSQFEVQKRDRFGVTHAFDVHWKVSTQPVFADVLTFGDIAARACPLPALGPSAFAPADADALLLACIHPVMHHQNSPRLVWLFDILLLASRLTSDEARLFVQLARDRKVAAVCAHQLRLVQDLFGVSIGSAIIDDLADAGGAEPSAAYLASNRKWRDELVSSVRGLPRFGDRVRLVRQVLFPAPAYMLAAYGFRANALAPLLLPALYVHRNIRGAWNVLAGKK